MKIGDIVSRKKYHQDIIFEVIDIQENICYLRGIEYRLIADSEIDDLELVQEKRVIEDVHLPQEKCLKGSVLHLDGDPSYLKMCMKKYQEYGIRAYGYYFKEVEATIKAARASHPDRRLVMLFQPHRYSRTRDCFDDFVDVLSQVDQLLLLEVYSAGEKPIVGADSRALARSIRLRGEVEPILIDPVEGNLEPVIQKVLQANDLLLTQGAGNVGAISIELAQNQLYLK